MPLVGGFGCLELVLYGIKKSWRSNSLEMISTSSGEHYRSPWAASREIEEKHREISAALGASLKGFNEIQTGALSLVEVSNTSDFEWTSLFQ